MLTDLCKSEVEGWEPFPLYSDQLTFVHREYGMSLNVSVTQDKKFMHVSIGPVRKFREDLNDEEHASLILEKTPETLTQFFEARRFVSSKGDFDLSAGLVDQLLSYHIST